MHSRKMDYQYSLVTSISPRIVYTLQSREYQKLTRSVRSQCVNLRAKMESLWKILSSPSEAIRLLVECQNDKQIDAHADLGENEEPYYVTRGSNTYSVSLESLQICFTDAYFFAQMWLSPTDKLDTTIPFSREEKVDPYQIQYLYGVYWFQVDHTYESHGFVLFLEVETVTVMNTYGGTIGVFMIEHTRVEFFRMWEILLSDSVEEQSKIYPLIWGFRQRMVSQIVDQMINKQDPLIISGAVYAKLY